MQSFLRCTIKRVAIGYALLLSCSLALLGLYSLQFSGRMTTPESSTSAVSPALPPVTLENDGINSKKQSLKDSLLGSV